MVSIAMTDIITEIANAAHAHRHSVEKRLAGLPVRGRVAGRIDAELARRGIVPAAPSLPKSPSTPPVAA
jgi:hypothetical protein